MLQYQTRPETVAITPNTSFVGQVEVASMAELAEFAASDNSHRDIAPPIELTDIRPQGRRHYKTVVTNDCLPLPKDTADYHEGQFLITHLDWLATVTTREQTYRHPSAQRGRENERRPFDRTPSRHTREYNTQYRATAYGNLILPGAGIEVVDVRLSVAPNVTRTSGHDFTTRWRTNENSDYRSRLPQQTIRLYKP